MKRSVTKNGITVTYELTRKAVKNINLRVRRDGTAAVSAPKSVPAERIDRFVLDNAEKILAAQKKTEEISRNGAIFSPEIRDGGTIILLGERYTIRFLESIQTPIADTDTRTLFFPADGTPVLFDRWLTAYASDIFLHILTQVHPQFAPYGIPFPTLRVRRMTSRWGSCIPDKNTITLNIRLIHYPISSIKYVLTHELCHFPEPNHSARFYEWMEKMLPNWKKEKERLSRSPLGS